MWWQGFFFIILILLFDSLCPDQKGFNTYHLSRVSTASWLGRWCWGNSQSSPLCQSLLAQRCSLGWGKCGSWFLAQSHSLWFEAASKEQSWEQEGNSGRAQGGMGQPHLWELLQNLLWWGLGFPAFLLHTFCLQNPLWIPERQSRLSPREKPEGFVSPQRDQSVFESTNLIWATPQLLLERGDQFGCSAREKLLWQGRDLRCCLFQPGSHPHTEWEFSVTLWDLPGQGAWDCSLERAEVLLREEDGAVDPKANVLEVFCNRIPEEN